MKRLFCLLFLIFPVLTYAEINPANISKENAALDKKADMECKKHQNNMQKQVICIVKVKETYRKQGKYRGTREYAATHYNSLSPSELKAKLQKLRALRESARLDGDTMLDPVPGEITEEGYDNEIAWIENKLNGY